jgi:hypothetical protein
MSMPQGIHKWVITIGSSLAFHPPFCCFSHPLGLLCVGWKDARFFFELFTDFAFFFLILLVTLTEKPWKWLSEQLYTSVCPRTSLKRHVRVCRFQKKEIFHFAYIRAHSLFWLYIYIYFVCCFIPISFFLCCSVIYISIYLYLYLYIHIYTFSAFPLLGLLMFRDQGAYSFSFICISLYIYICLCVCAITLSALSSSGTVFLCAHLKCVYVCCA